MDNIGKRIAAARERVGLNQTELGKRVRVSRAAVSQWESGDTIPTGPNLVAIAKAVQVSPEWLASGKGPRELKTPYRRLTNVVGYVGAGAKVFIVDDHAMGAALEQVPAPPGYEEECVAVRVRGDSLYPQVEDGWLIYYAKDVDGVPDEAIGKLCVVKLTSGEMMVKKIYRAEKKGRFRLDSVNAPALHDVSVEWAARVLAITPS